MSQVRILPLGHLAHGLAKLNSFDTLSCVSSMRGSSVGRASVKSNSANSSLSLNRKWPECGKSLHAL